MTLIVIATTFNSVTVIVVIIIIIIIIIIVIIILLSLSVPGSGINNDNNKVRYTTSTVHYCFLQPDIFFLSASFMLLVVKVTFSMPTFIVTP